MTVTDPYPELFTRHRSAAVPALWPWQSEVLTVYAGISCDAAIELPTGTGKTLLGLLTGEHFRENEGGPVAYLAGNKQLAQQIERHARELRFPVVRFQGPKDTWVAKDVRAFNFGQAIGVMNYWNYFNASPGVEPAGMLIMDDVHLLEGPLRDLFTVSIRRDDDVCKDILQRIISQCPYYSLADDLLHGVDPLRPPEMLAFPDSADLADEVRDLLDARLQSGSEAWWSWQRIRTRLEVCCWLVSVRGISFTPYIPPTQTLAHLESPTRRLYLSATIGSVDDLQRRLGIRPLTKLTSSVQPRQGERLIVVRSGTDTLDSTALVEELRPFLMAQTKALWLCARRETAKSIEAALVLSGLDGEVRRLEADNGADEPFAADSAGHLIAAGRYDGMDFPGDTCRLEILPEVPVATSDLEEFVSAYLRDAPFAEARFGQRVAQALGRCNRGVDDRAVYLLADPEFAGRFSQLRALNTLPIDVRDDVFTALERSDRGFEAGLEDAQSFLAGASFEPLPAPRGSAPGEQQSTAGDEVAGILALWREDYARAASLFDRVALGIARTPEHRALWLATRALALRLAGQYGNGPAATEAKAALRAAASTGASSTFFTRLRLAEARLEGTHVSNSDGALDDIFSTWDRLIDRFGAQGPRFDQWAQKLVEGLRSEDHDAVSRAVAQVGTDILGLPAAARRPTSGEEDADWELPSPRRVLGFEVKLSPIAQRVVNDDVEQAEGAARALASQRNLDTRALILTPYDAVEETAKDRLERVRLINRSVFVEQVRRLLELVRDYRRGWTSEAATRTARRGAVAPHLPPVDWLWSATERSSVWVESETLDATWRSIGSA